MITMTATPTISGVDIPLEDVLDGVDVEDVPLDGDEVG